LNDGTVAIHTCGHSLADFRRDLARIPGVTAEAAQRMATQLRRELAEAMRKAGRAAARARAQQPAGETPLPPTMPAAPSTTFALAMPRGAQ
jgi:hypothetical protein